VTVSCPSRSFCPGKETPIRCIRVTCCARAAHDQTAVAPPKSGMKSRRLMCCPKFRGPHPTIPCENVHHSKLRWPMSQLGHSRRLAGVLGMSASPQPLPNCCAAARRCFYFAGGILPAAA
jgi:hypothetical protein